MYPKPPDFPLSTSNVISMQSYHNKNDYAITMLSQPTLTVSSTLNYPSMTIGDPLTAPKIPVTRPKLQYFPFFTSHVICVQFYHCKNTYAITMLS